MYPAVWLTGSVDGPGRTTRLGNHWGRGEAPAIGWNGSCSRPQIPLSASTRRARFCSPTWLATNYGLQYVGYYLTASAALTLVGLSLIKETRGNAL
ncbi:MAG TPA: hypothetical protein VG267_16170 [Terracidiphilus sp.]|nr:hypothetical protein [Terracidiphilus sp.]